MNLVVSLPTTQPPAPTNLTAVSANGVIALNWSASATATNYHVWRSFTSGTGYTLLTTVATTNYSDTLVTNGVTYFYVVSALGPGGESADSSEASATEVMPSFVLVTANVFSDVFSNSTLNSISPSAPTATNTSYEVLSSKSWSPTPTLPGGHLKFGIASTSSGSIEAQALFANAPVVLTNAGDSISLLVTFTNTSGLLAQTNVLGFGLYASGGNYPVAGGLNGTATSSSTANAAGAAQTWVGYVGQLSFTNASSQIITRPAQVNGTLVNNDQDVLTTGSNSSSFTNNPPVTIGTASTAASVVVAAGSPARKS